LGIDVSLHKFISGVWKEADRDMEELETLRKTLENLRTEENVIYQVTVQSNNE